MQYTYSRILDQKFQKKLLYYDDVFIVADDNDDVYKPHCYIYYLLLLMKMKCHTMLILRKHISIIRPSKSKLFSMTQNVVYYLLIY